MSFSGTQLDPLFALAVDIVTSRLPKNGQPQVTSKTKLILYAQYKQATEGDVTTSRPSLLDLLGRAKWDAWKSQQGLKPSEAKSQYVESLARILRDARDDALCQNLYQELQATAGPEVPLGK